MKLVDPIGGLKLMSFNWPINLTLILLFTFMLLYFPDVDTDF